MNEKKNFSRQSNETTWQHRNSKDIHSGVRVKIPSNRIQTMIKRLWIESEASALIDNGQKSSPWKKQILTKDHNEKFVNSTGTQTMIIERIDREISCQLIDKHRSLSSSSFSSSDTSTSNDHSTQTETTSSISSNSSHTASNNHSPKNTDRNNNASDVDVKCMNEEDLNRQKTFTRLVVFEVD